MATPTAAETIAQAFLYLIVYRYYPIFLQFVLAFKKYKIKGGIWGSDWVGAANFVKMFTSNNISRLFVNTMLWFQIRLYSPPLSW